MFISSPNPQKKTKKKYTKILTEVASGIGIMKIFIINFLYLNFFYTEHIFSYILSFIKKISCYTKNCKWINVKTRRTRVSI